MSLGISWRLPGIDTVYRQKVSLYADIQAKVDEHKNALEDRSKELIGGKRDLVKRSGSAIGKED